MHASQIAAWKKKLKESAVEVFAGKRELLNEASMGEERESQEKLPIRELEEGWQSGTTNDFKSTAMGRSAELLSCAGPWPYRTLFYLDLARVQNSE